MEAGGGVRGPSWAIGHIGGGPALQQRLLEIGRKEHCKVVFLKALRSAVGFWQDAGFAQLAFCCLRVLRVAVGLDFLAPRKFVELYEVWQSV